LGVCSSQNSVDFFAETVIQKAQVSVAKPVSKDANTWQSVVYSLYKDQLTGYVDKPFSTSTKEVKGSLVRNHRGLVIGGGGECGGFTGAIDQIYVFLCNPRAR
uniref:hypothetical protein n=1 Tax=Staphylococcus aureus TaxID=1280 RepID=UPI0038B38438